MNQYAERPPFELYELYLFGLVAKHESFTKAAESAGLTQSAMTRQIQALEQRLAATLFARTTRKVHVTEAGAFLYQEAVQLLGNAALSVRRLREEYANTRPQVRLGVSRTVGLAHLPGLLHANVNSSPDVSLFVSSGTSSTLISSLEANSIDVAVMCSPKVLPKTLRVTHRFKDAFALVVHRNQVESYKDLPNSRRARKAWLQKQRWLMLDSTTTTGVRLSSWMKREGISVEPSMELDNFDLIVNLVSLGMGISFVPIRVLALYSRKRNLCRIPLRSRFERELVVVTRKHRKLPKHLENFIGNILFSR